MVMSRRFVISAGGKEVYVYPLHRFTTSMLVTSARQLARFLAEVEYLPNYQVIALNLNVGALPARVAKTYLPASETTRGRCTPRQYSRVLLYWGKALY